MVNIDDQAIPVDIKHKQYPGVLVFQVPKGSHRVDVTYLDTGIRRIAEGIGVSALLGLLFVPGLAAVRRSLHKSLSR